MTFTKKNMSKILLQSQNPRTKGQSYTLPIVGDVTFDQLLNTIEVTQEQSDKLMQLNFGMKLLPYDGVINKPKEIIIDPTKEKEIAEYKEMLEGMNDADLDNLLADHDKKKTKGLKTRDKKIEFLIGTL